jgi:hypothetical protein
MDQQRSRWFWVGGCLVFSALMLLCGWLMPIHLRAVDGGVLQRAGLHSPSLAEHTLELLRQGRTAGVPLLVETAEKEQTPDAATISQAAHQAGTGSGYRLPGSDIVFPAGEPVTPFVIKLANRDKLLEVLMSSQSLAVQELLRTRALTNTVLFPPSSSSSGQAYDAAVTIAGLLLEQNGLTPNLSAAVRDRAATANAGNPEPLEAMLMDFLSLGQRFDFGQLQSFVGHIQTPAALQTLAGTTRNAAENLPELYSVVDLTQQPDAVAAYLNNFSQTGLADLGKSLRYGEGGLDELLHRSQRLYESPTREKWTASGLPAMFYRAGADYALRLPWFALALKWCFYLSCGFLLALAAHLARPAARPLEEGLEVRGAHWARELLFALGFLLVVLLFSEPFLAQESQKADFPFRLRLPALGGVAASATTQVKNKIMDTKSLLTLLLFFVLQALIYSACRVKLTETRRQNVPARVRLKLLENEEHLFDAGLYLGFAGTIVSLILVSMHLIQQQSLMAAYSSTAFGIIFVSFFKIFDLRPVRRQFLLQAEKESHELAPDAPVPNYATKHSRCHLRFPPRQPVGVFDGGYQQDFPGRRAAPVRK